jgi:DNA polymerase-3 subunit delta'
VNTISAEIFGQQKALGVLQKFSQSGKIPHALLFNGSDGIGKFYTAREFVKFINSGNEGRLIPSVEKKIHNLSEPYIKYIFPLPRGKNETGDDTPTSKLSKDVLEEIQSQLKLKSDNPYHKIVIEKANIIKISSIREIQKFISINYDDIKYRVIIINHAHLMNHEAQNALLKNLEEPPPGIIFILLTSAVNKLLPTILSRCWQVNFQPLLIDEVKSILLDHFEVDESTAKKAAFFSNGSVNTALQLIENDVQKLIEQTIFILRYSLAKRYSTAYQALNNLVKDAPAVKLPLIAGMMIKWLSDVIKNRYNFEEYYFEEYKDTVFKFNEKFRHVEINQLINRIDALQSYLSRNVSLNLITMNIILELASIRLR